MFLLCLNLCFGNFPKFYTLRIQWGKLQIFITNRDRNLDLCWPQIHTTCIDHSFELKHHLLGKGRKYLKFKLVMEVYKAQKVNNKNDKSTSSKLQDSKASYWW